MEDKTKVVIFERKELALIFIGMIVMAFITFSFGVKIGKKYAFQKAGYTEADHQLVELKSTEEESVDQVLRVHEKQASGHSDSPKSPHAPVHQAEDDHHSENHVNIKNLEDEFQQLDKEMNKNSPALSQHPPSTGKTGQPSQTQRGGHRSETKSHDHGHGDKASPGPSPAIKEASFPDVLTMEGHGAKEEKEEGKMEGGDEAYSGKYTIQLGSYQLESDAIKFADGFKVRGYNPIIHEVKIEGKGMWYRVSLGTFENLSQAKEYILKEESLFQGQDYVISEIR